MTNEPVLNQGAHNNQLFLVITGRLDAVGDHQEKLASIDRYGFIGEMSFLSNNTASASVIAAVETTCYIWNKPSLDKLFRKQGLFKAYLY